MALKPANNPRISGNFRQRCWEEIPHVTQYFRLIAAAQLFDAGC